MNRFPRLVSDDTPAGRVKALQAQIALLSVEQVSELIDGFETVLQRAGDVADNPSSQVGPRDVARRAILVVEPILATLKSMRARA